MPLRWTSRQPAARVRAMFQWLMDRLGRGSPVVPVVRLSGVIASGHMFGARGLSIETVAPLLARAFAGHCAMKAAITGQTSLGAGLRDQWNRMAGGQVDHFDAQEDVEEWADPAALEEGLAINKPGTASSSATQH